MVLIFDSTRFAAHCWHRRIASACFHKHTLLDCDNLIGAGAVFSVGDIFFRVSDKGGMICYKWIWMGSGRTTHEWFITHCVIPINGLCLTLWTLVNDDNLSSYDVYISDNNAMQMQITRIWYYYLFSCKFRWKKEQNILRFPRIELYNFHFIVIKIVDRCFIAIYFYDCYKWWTETCSWNFGEELHAAWFDYTNDLNSTWLNYSCHSFEQINGWAQMFSHCLWIKNSHPCQANLTHIILFLHFHKT